MYFTIYCSLIIPLFILLNSINLITSKQLRKLVITHPLAQLSISILLISLAGLPPITGFIPKILAIIILSQYSAPLIFILIIGSLINLYFYLNIIINTMLLNKNISITLFDQIKSNKVVLVISRVTSIGLAPIIIIYAMTILYKP